MASISLSNVIKASEIKYSTIKDIKMISNSYNNVLNEYRKTDINIIDPIEINHFDLTGYSNTNWHITTNGINHYVWCGDESTTLYKSNWNDALYLTIDEKLSMDWSSYSTSINISFDSYEFIEGFPFDYGYIEVNPHVSNPDSYWYQFINYIGQYKPYWTTNKFEADPSMFYNGIINNNLLNQEGGFTGDMGIRFIFKSDESLEYRGWFLDNININGSQGTLYKLNPCNNMDYFIAENKHSGDWWFKDSLFNGWTCMNKLYGIIPNDVNNSLEIKLPRGIFHELTYYHDYNLDFNGDYCYLEISTDAGKTWTCSSKYTGSFIGNVSINMSSYIGKCVIIRWRVKTNSTCYSKYYSVGDIIITGEIDLEAPITTIDISGKKLREWYSTPVTITTNAIDNVSGLSITYYKINSGPTLVYYEPFIINKNDKNYIEYWSVDKVGNEEKHHIIDSIKIDTITPIINIVKPEPGLYLFGENIISTNNIIIIGTFTYKAIAVDNNSDIYSVSFLLNDVEFYKSLQKPYIAYCSAKNFGYANIKVIAEDFAGNTAQDSISIVYIKLL